MPEEEIAVNDIVTFRNDNGFFITHRVIEIKNLGLGTKQFITKGDASAGVDTEFVNYDKIMGVYQKKIAILSILISATSNIYVFLILIILPLLIIFALQIKNLVQVYKEHNKE